MGTNLNAKVKVKPASNELTAEQWLKETIGIANFATFNLQGYSMYETFAFMEAYAKYKNGKA